jgi:hypothetical protein
VGSNTGRRKRQAIVNSRLRRKKRMPSGLTVQPVRNGHGIVALRAFEEGDTVCGIPGRIVSASQVWRYWYRDPRRGENCFRFDENHYLDPEGGIGAFANHSCSPNAGIRKYRGRLYLVALRRIPAGKEVTHDYSSLLGVDDVWSMSCNCGYAFCRGKVGNVATIPIRRLSRYVRLGFVPKFIWQKN